MMGMVALLSIVGLVLCAFFCGTETGFYRATRLRLVLDGLGGDRIARSLLFLVNHPALVVATTLVGSNVATYLISMATVLAAENLFPANPYLTEVLAPLLVAPLLLVWGELLPKNLYLHAPNRLLRRGGPAFLVSIVLLFPLAGILWALSRLMGRMVGEAREPVHLTIARRELGRILEEGHEVGILHRSQRSLAQGIFAVAGLPVTEFLAPLAALPPVHPGMLKEEVLRLAAAHKTALLPVVAAAGSDVLIGYVRVVDLSISAGQALAPLRNLAEMASQTTHLAALMQLENTGESLARVVGIDGQTLGLVSLERLRGPLFAGPTPVATVSRDDSRAS